MAIFDYYVMVDWSGGGRRRGNRADAIWIAHGARNAPIPDTESPYSRTEAERRIRQIISLNLEEGLRVLLCCDFGYGYPGGFSAGLPAASGPAWKAVWRHLHAALQACMGHSGVCRSQAPIPTFPRISLCNRFPRRKARQ
jgi:hypothetical protein